MSTNKKKLFVMDDGKNLMFTFILVSSLFLLWGFCNGMIDVMDKHFQEELHLSLSQSAWVQFAHYLGYFLMSLPAGWLAIRLGYKGGIIAGLLMVAVGGFWFIPASHIAQFWAFLLGVCVIASGLTFLETVANPYTTVLGPREFAATRINLAQSCNGIGWFFGPIAGSMYFYSKNAQGVSTGSQTLYIPYAGVAVVVIILAVIFYFASVPDVNTEDDYHLDDQNAGGEAAEVGEREINRPLVFCLLLLNAAVLIGACGMLAYVILSTVGLNLSSQTWCLAAGVSLIVAAALLLPATRRISGHSIWSHPHFSAATLAQFFYVAAQAGIFSFFINTMTPNGVTGFSIVPPIPTSWDSTMSNIAAHAGFLHNWLSGWFEADSAGVLCISNKGASNLQSVGFLCFLLGRFTGAGFLKRFPAHFMLGAYGVFNVLVCFLIFSNAGWLSVVGVFLSFFFMSIMFPTIFALGIFGLGVRAKRAAAYIVMAIIGGALLPKLMGYVAEKHNMAYGYLIPMGCFALVALYAFNWSKLSKADNLLGKQQSPPSPALAKGH